MKYLCILIPKIWSTMEGVWDHLLWSTSHSALVCNFLKGFNELFREFLISCVHHKALKHFANSVSSNALKQTRSSVALKWISCKQVVFRSWLFRLHLNFEGIYSFRFKRMSPIIVSSVNFGMRLKILCVLCMCDHICFHCYFSCSWNVKMFIYIARNSL